MKRYFIFSAIFLFLLLIQYFMCFETPRNDAYAYYNIAKNIIKTHKASTNEIFPVTIPYINQIPAPILRRSILYSYFCVPILLIYDSVLSLSFFSAFITFINLILMIYITRKIFGSRASFFAGVLYAFNPEVYSMAFSGIAKPIFLMILLLSFDNFFSSMKSGEKLPFIISMFLFGISLYLRPHMLLYIIGIVIFHIKKVELKKIQIIILVFLISTAPLHIYKQKHGVNTSFSKYFILDEVGRKFNNHVFERMLNPPSPTKYILDNKLSFIKKVVRKIMNLVKMFLIHPYNSIILIFPLFFWKKIKPSERDMLKLIYIIIGVIALFSIVFVERYRYFWSAIIVFILPASKVFSYLSTKSLKIAGFNFFLLFIFIFVFNVSKVKSFPSFNYFAARKKVMEEFNPEIKKGVFTDIPWVGSAFLNKPSIWLPNNWKDVYKIKNKTGIDLILVSGLWIEPDKLINKLDELKVLKKYSFIYKGNPITAFLYKIPDKM